MTAVDEHDEDWNDQIDEDYLKTTADSFDCPTLARAHCLMVGVGCVPDFKCGIMMCVEMARAGDVAAKQFLQSYNQKTIAEALARQALFFATRYFDENVVPLFGRKFKDEFLVDLVVALEEVELSCYFAPKGERESTFEFILGIFDAALPGLTERSHLACYEKGPVQGDTQFQIPGAAHEEYVHRLTMAYANWVWRSHCFRFDKNYSADDVPVHAEFLSGVRDFIRFDSPAAVLSPLKYLETIYYVDGIPFK